MALAHRFILLTSVVAIASSMTHGEIAASGFSDSADQASFVAAASLSGWYGSAYTEGDIQIFDVQGELQQTVSRERLQATLPDLDWSHCSASIGGIEFSHSGRLLFAAVADPGSDLDAILRYDTTTDELDVFHRTFFTNELPGAMRIPIVFYAGQLYVGDSEGRVLVFNAGRSASFQEAPASTVTVSTQQDIAGLAIDPSSSTLFVASAGGLYRVPLDQSPLVPQRFDGQSNIVDLDVSDHFGDSSQAELLLLRHDEHGSDLLAAPTDEASGGGGRFRPAVITQSDAKWHDIAATACGRVLVGDHERLDVLADSSDQRLGFDGWIQDEFDQVLAYTKALIQPSGWVLDGSPPAGRPVTPPASPDAAMWAVLMLMAADEITPDPNNQELIASILTRYAGLSDDNIAPSRSADGFFEHWLDPATGSVYLNFPQEFAVYSTMKIALGADRAAQAYPNHPEITAAAESILCSVQNQASYFDGNQAVFLIGEALGGPRDPGPRNMPFVEGILFAEQAEVFDPPMGTLIYRDWANPRRWPTASFIEGREIVVALEDRFQTAFITLYPLLLISRFRDDPRWLDHSTNVYDSFAAWTDDHAPSYFTAFSAGGGFNGYQADSLSSHPNDIAHFPAVMGFATLGRTDPAVAAYHAYRAGARTDLQANASMLVRRSADDPAWESSIGMPDATYGALGLAELLSPGITDRLLAKPYVPRSCDSANP
ncbi:MAG: hypothetical protein AAGB34_04840 [Planctomycetota bacterium]